MLLWSSVYANNEWQITEAYSNLCQTTKVKCFTKIVCDFELLTIFAKILS